jgi:serine protease Do
VRAPGCPTALMLLRVVGALASTLAATSVLAGLPEVVEGVKPSIVAVGTFQKTRSPPFVFRGTGFAVGDGTLIATVAHAVSPEAQGDPPETLMVLVSVPGAREAQGREAKPVAVDRVHDVALLRIGGAPLTALTLGNSKEVRDGAAIAFTGFPFGNAFGFNPVTHRGIVSSQPPIAMPSPNAKQLDSRVIRGVNAGPFVLFQLDAIAYAGHSGSPVYAAETGTVIGLISMTLKGSKDAAIGLATGISFAVPVQYVEDLIRGLR